MSGKRIKKHVEADFHIPGEVALPIYEAVQRGDTRRAAELFIDAMIAAGVVPPGTRPEDIDVHDMVMQIGRGEG